MTPDPQALAALHAAAFEHPRPWTAAEFAALLRDPGISVIALPPRSPQALAVIRTVAGEAELLTIAVTPPARGQGLGRAVLERALSCARQSGAQAVFLEVAADNTAALRLYGRAGFLQVGRRPGYYGAGIDALILRRTAP